MPISCSWSNGNFQVRLQYDGTKVPTFYLKFTPTLDLVGIGPHEVSVSQTSAEELHVMLKAAIDQANINWQKSILQIQRVQGKVTSEMPEMREFLLPEELRGGNNEDSG